MKFRKITLFFTPFKEIKTLAQMVGQLNSFWVFIVIEEDLMRVIEKPRSFGKMLVTFDATFIALIPKI